MSISCLNQLAVYIPRHFRLGVCAKVRDVEQFHEIPENVPIVDSAGRVIRTDMVLRRVLASEDMLKYRYHSFKLSALKDSGVPLSVVNVNGSTSLTLDQVESIASRLDGAEKYVELLQRQREERESWFKEPASDDSVL